MKNKDKIKNIEEKIKNNAKKDAIDNEIKLANKNHMYDISDLDSSNENAFVKNEKQIQMSREHINNIADLHSDAINAEFGLEEDDKYEKEEKQEEKKNIKNRSFMPKILIGIVVATIIAGTSCLYTYKSHEDTIDEKIESYTDDLEEVIDKATFHRIGNLVYQNGEVVEVLDEDKTANGEYTYIQYGDISSYIENSDNPDLAAFALYRNYGRSPNPEYHRIVTKTFKTLEFDGSEIGSDKNFQTYIDSNDFETYDDYYKTLRKELFTDSDSELDNIKTKIKKMTK